MNANGWAEGDGKFFCDVLKRVANEKEREGQSWLELLKMAVRLHHNMANPETGFSLYQLVFGRDRPGVGVLFSSVESV